MDTLRTLFHKAHYSLVKANNTSGKILLATFHECCSELLPKETYRYRRTELQTCVIFESVTQIRQNRTRCSYTLYKIFSYSESLGILVAVTLPRVTINCSSQFFTWNSSVQIKHLYHLKGAYILQHVTGVKLKLVAMPTSRNPHWQMKQWDTVTHTSLCFPQGSLAFLQSSRAYIFYDHLKEVINIENHLDACQLA